MSATHPLNQWPVLEPGDIILTHGRGLFSVMIRFFGRLASGDSKVNHAAMFIGSFGEGDCYVVEAVGRIRIERLAVYDDTPCRVWRMNGLSQDMKVAIRAKATSINSQGYGWTKLPLFVLDSLFRTYWFTQKMGITHYKVCSQFIAWAYCKALGLDTIFGIGWRSVSPDRMDDHCIAHSALWHLVHDSLTKK
jgi:hypothetical protein